MKSANPCGKYFYPNTEVCLLYAGNDESGALNQGLTYYEQLVSPKSPLLHMQVVEGSRHAMSWDSTGFEELRKTLFAEVDIKTTTNKK